MNAIKSDLTTRILYATDASILEVLPESVAFPEKVEDINGILELAKARQLSITPRGAATGITGGCLGDGIIIDCSLHLNQILSIDPIAQKAVVEPGVIQDQLNQAAASHGLRLGPDTSTGDRATIGGMIGNCAAGSRSLFYGTTRDALLEVELLLSTGDTITLKELGETEWQQKLELETQEGVIYRTLESLRQNDRAKISEAFPPLPRRASGYALDCLIGPFPINPAKLIAGAEGSLGIIKQATLKLAKVLNHPVLAILPYHSLQEAFADTKRLLKYRPISLELIDDKILEAGRNAPQFKNKISWLPEKSKALLVAEFEKESLPHGIFEQIIEDPQTMNEVWQLRKMGLGLLLSKRSYSRALAFIEDLSIPPDHLAPFMDEFLSYLKSCGKEAGIYGHAGPGCMHIRPYVDIRNPEEVEQIKQMMVEITKLIRSYHGSLSGEHGDGLIRSWLNPQLFGSEINALFQRIKQAFDPLGIMNPHKVVNPIPFEEHLKKSPSNEPKTFFSFQKEGGLALSADLCNGNGACRKREGLMCPSFQVTHEEYDSTRGRANALRAVIRGDFETKDLSAPELHGILDLCIQCKGCKTECPSHVDMAKMKSEVLYHWHQKMGIRLRERLFAHIDRINALFYPFRKLINPLLKCTFLNKWTGIAADRKLPLFADQKFSELFTKLKQPQGKPLVLINDTYTEYYSPEIGIAAVKLFNRLGYQVVLPRLSCCGRALLSKGFLPEAKEKARRLIQSLLPYAQKGVPLIGLEPSCFFSLKDEYRDFYPEEMEQIDPHLFLFDDFLETLRPLPLKPVKHLDIHLHGHCHHKALEGLAKTHLVLKSISGITLHEIPTGCCGMAGSFGYEAEHAEFSQRIANLVLFPYLDKLPSDAIIVANGFSCRAQIATKGRQALHLAELLETFV
jgi:FAD/FMN-containing dehydrogenase/Fe-S oxidoreductase